VDAAPVSHCAHTKFVLSPYRYTCGVGLQIATIKTNQYSTVEHNFKSHFCEVKSSRLILIKSNQVDLGSTWGSF